MKTLIEVDPNHGLGRATDASCVKAKTAFTKIGEGGLMTVFDLVMVFSIPVPFLVGSVLVVLGADSCSYDKFGR